MERQEFSPRSSRRQVLANAAIVDAKPADLPVQATNQIGCEVGQSVVLVMRPAILDREMCYPFGPKHGRNRAVETTRVYHAARRHGGGVAARGTRAAAADAGNRIPQQLGARRSCTLFDRIPPRPS